MLVILSHSHKDRDLAVMQARHIAKLGGVLRHDCIVACNKLSEYGVQDIVDILTPAFNSVSSFIPYDENEEGWPQSPTHMFKRVAQHVAWVLSDVPFLWMEPDAVPMASQWINELSAEYAASGKPFMGAYVNIPPVHVHMSGVGIYRSVPDLCPTYATITGAWDNDLSEYIIPNAHITTKIQHDWKPDKVSPKAGTLIYHQDKGGELYGTAKNEVLSESFSSTANTDWAEERKRMQSEIDQLKAERPYHKKSHRVGFTKPKKTSRSPEEQAKIDARMKKARESRKK